MDKKDFLFLLYIKYNNHLLKTRIYTDFFFLLLGRTNGIALFIGFNLCEYASIIYFFLGFVRYKVITSIKSSCSSNITRNPHYRLDTFLLPLPPPFQFYPSHRVRYIIRFSRLCHCHLYTSKFLYN